MTQLKLFVVALLLPLALTVEAQAFSVFWHFHDTENHKMYFIVEDDGYYIWLVTHEDLGYIDGAVLGPSNPNPEDGKTEPGDRSIWGQLLKQQGGLGYLTPEFYDTMIGAYLSDAGYGIGPYYNPADGDGHGGVDPSGGISFFDPRELMNEVGGAGKLGGIEYDGNGGPARDQIKNAAGKNGSSNGDDEDSGADPPPGSGFWGDDMPGPPELVNPAPTKAEYELW